MNQSIEVYIISYQPPQNLCGFLFNARRGFDVNPPYFIGVEERSPRPLLLLVSGEQPALL
jgi:hypothetical protein